MKDRRPGDLVDLELNAIPGQHEHLAHEGDRHPVGEQLRIQSHLSLCLDSCLSHEDF